MTDPDVPFPIPGHPFPLGPWSPDPGPVDPEPEDWELTGRLERAAI